MKSNRRVALTLKEAQKECRDLGYTLIKRDDEYIVKNKGAKNDDGYFTNDIQDAVDTCVRMYECRRENQQDAALAPQLGD